MNNFKNLIFILLIAFSNWGFSQCGMSGETLEILSDEDLQNLEGCDSIFGNLYISLIENSFLEPLSDLEYIEGFLHIEGCVSLLDIEDFSNLLYIGDYLNLESNFTLQNLNGFHSLVYLGNDLIINGNWSIESLNDFSSLETINGDLIIRQNNVLENINGLESIQQISGNLIIESNNVDLNNLSGLNGLINLQGNWRVSLDELATINGFFNLESIGDTLEIKDFSVLSNVNGFSSLVEVGTLIIEDNDNFVNASGFENLLTVNGDCTIQNNQALFLCCGIYPLLSEGDISGETIISNNSGPCSSVPDITEECFFDSVGEEKQDISPRIKPIQNGFIISGEFDHWTLNSVQGRIIDQGTKPIIIIDQGGFYVLNIIYNEDNISYKISK